MSRERMVTRTIKIDETVILTMNKSDRTVVECVFRVNAELKMSDAEIVTRYNETHTESVAVMVLSHDVKERLFSMPEETFMLYAIESAPRGEKEDA